jgi:lipocalin
MTNITNTDDVYCVTTKYGDNGDGTMSVHNYETVGSPTGFSRIIDGYAYNMNSSAPSEMKIHSADTETSADVIYWILGLGPLNDDKLYDYCIMSDNLTFLVVLARDISTFNKKYRDEVVKTLDSLGLSITKAPADTYHGEDCIYE